jgi:hypothetical protein
LPSRRNETGFEQAVLEQISNPLGITHLRLASRHRFDVLGVDHQPFKVAFQQID